MERIARGGDLGAKVARRIARGAHLLLLCGVLAAGLPGCTRVEPIAEANYATAIVGEWQGSVGDEKETISLRADGSFRAQLRERGFISNTLSQGVTGTIRGTWTLAGAVVTLTITTAEDARVANATTSSTIVAMSQDELSLRSANGETSVFRRTTPL
jgi:hypothetical protein